MLLDSVLRSLSSVSPMVDAEVDREDDVAMLDAAATTFKPEHGCSTGWRTACARSGGCSCCYPETTEGDPTSRTRLALAARTVLAACSQLARIAVCSL